jgi:hypothetical protein
MNLEPFGLLLWLILTGQTSKDDVAKQKADYLGF